MNPRSSEIDAIYTPESVAQELAKALPLGFKGKVIDPAVGAGALLRAVDDRFGTDVELLGLDVDPSVVAMLRKEKPSWHVGNADLLSHQSRNSSRPWRAARESLSAVVMNPPFSYRGNGGTVISYGDFVGRVTPSIQFLVEVLRTLRPAFGFFVILPDGALDAERNESIWKEIQLNFEVSRISRLRANTFVGVRVSTSIVHLQSRVSPLTSLETKSFETDKPDFERKTSCRCLEVVRGRMPVHKLRNFANVSFFAKSAPFLHTTNLQDSGKPMHSAPDKFADQAPLVLISRVGTWRNPRAVEKGRVVLSDCVFGLRPRHGDNLPDVLNTVSDHKAQFLERFRGTGAPYLTLTQLSQVLLTAGWHVHIVKASTPPAECCCGFEQLNCQMGPGDAISRSSR